MNQLTAPTHTFEDNIPIWMRIREIMKEKGTAYSVTAMSARLGMSRETLRVMLSGEREIYSFELENIANDLKVPLRRLLQEDLFTQQNKKTISQLNAESRFHEAMKLAEDRMAVSLGYSEKAYSIILIAWTHFWREEFEDAKQMIGKIIHEGLGGKEKYHNQELLSKALIVFLNIYTHSNELDKVLEILDRVVPLLESDPLNMGVVYVALAKMKYSNYEHAEAKKYIYKCLELYLTTDDRDRIGRAYINAAWAEYADREYSKAKELLEKAMEYCENEKVRLHGLKELAKVLLKRKELGEAERLIRKTLQTEQFDHELDLKARLIILLSKATRATRHAEGVAADLSYPKEARYLAHRYLTLVYKQERCSYRKGSSEKKLRGPLPKRQFPFDKNF